METNFKDMGDVAKHDVFIIEDYQRKSPCVFFHFCATQLNETVLPPSLYVP